MPVFDYEDIQLVPNKCIVKSRSEIDTRVKFGPMTFNIPVVPANMQTVIDEDLAIWLAQNGYFYIMHRFEENERVPFVKKRCTNLDSLPRSQSGSNHKNIN